MPTIFSHPAVPLALGYAASSGVVSSRLLAAGVACSMLPDLDVVGLWLGVPYGSAWGHRGATHSIAFALAVGLAGALAAGRLRASRLAAFAFLAAATASHGLLDALTDGGSGVAFLWPFDTGRWFLPWRPVEVSPIGVRALASDYFAHVLRSEIAWIWLPCIALAALGRQVRRAAATRAAAAHDPARPPRP